MRGLVASSPLATSGSWAPASYAVAIRAPSGAVGPGSRGQASIRRQNWLVRMASSVQPGSNHFHRVANRGFRSVSRVGSSRCPAPRSTFHGQFRPQVLFASSQRAAIECLFLDVAESSMGPGSAMAGTGLGLRSPGEVRVIWSGDPLDISTDPAEWPPVDTDLQTPLASRGPTIGPLSCRHMPKNGTGTRKACCSYKLQRPFQLVNWVK